MKNPTAFIKLCKENRKPAPLFYSVVMRLPFYVIVCLLSANNPDLDKSIIIVDPNIWVH